ncbi:MAG: DUF456 family protein [Propionibacteriales bacterium]|nr:DUF456 family protein [Propionibacteriales bacterium]
MGVVVPVLPGALLVWAAIAVWAAVTQTSAGWVVLAVATGSIAAVQIVKYVLPERRLRNAGVPRRSILIGGLAGLVGFFVLPIVGLLVGFVGGVYVAERRRIGDHAEAWRATVLAARLAGLTIVIELFGTLVAAATWLGAAAAT